MIDDKNEKEELNKIAGSVAKGAKNVGKWAIKPTFGIGVAKDILGTFEETFYSSKGFLKWLFRPKSPTPDLLFLEKIDDYHKRFKIRCRQERLNKKDLQDRESALQKQLNFWIYTILAFLLMSLIALIVNPFKLHYIIPVIGFLFLCLGKFSRVSFRLYQLKQKALMPFSEWCQKPEVWLHGKKILPGLASFFILGIATSISAFAQSTSISDIQTYAQSVPKTDLSLRWLLNLFPDASGDILTMGTGLSSLSGTTTGQDLFANMFQMSNSILLGIACAMMTYQTVIGTIATAHEGEILGRRWNTAFAPSRIVLGIGSLAPIKGYCMIQLLMINMLFFGYAIGDAVWKAEVVSITSGTPMIPKAPMTTSGGAVFNILKSEACVEYLNDNKASFWQVWKSNPGINVNPQPVQNSDGSITLDFGEVCGKMTWAAIPNLNVDRSSWGVGSDNFSISEKQASIDAYNQATKQFKDDRFKAVQALVNRVCGQSSSSSSCDSDNSWAKKIAQGKEAPGISGKDKVDTMTGFDSFVSGMVTAESAYTSSLMSSIQTMANAQTKNANQDLVNQAASEGWASAGAFNNSLVQMSSNMISMFDKAKPSYSTIDFTQLTDGDSKHVQDLIKDIEKKLNALSSSISNTLDSGISGDSRTIDNGGASVIGKVFNSPLSAYEATLVSKVFNVDETNPMASMQTQGLIFIALASSVFAFFLVSSMTGAGVQAGAEATGPLGIFARIASAAFNKGLTTVAPIVYTFIGSLLAFGIIEAYILPMVPYIMWTFSVFECAVFAVCVVVAAPFAAFMHVRLDGDELIGQQQSPIYKMMFEALFRPTMMVYGLIAFNKIFAVMTSYVDGTFQTAMMSAGTSSGLGVFGIVADVGMLVYIHYQLCTKSMELIHRVPEMVSKLCGIPSNFTDPTHTAHQVSGVAVNTGRTATRGTIQGVQNANSTQKQQKAQEAQRQAQTDRDNKQDATMQSIAQGLASLSGGGGEAIQQAKTGTGGSGTPDPGTTAQSSTEQDDANQTDQQADGQPGEDVQQGGGEAPAQPRAPENSNDD